MPRKVNGTADHDVERHDGPVGGGPVGNSNGYQGRPGGAKPDVSGSSANQQSRPSAGGPVNPERSGQTRGMGSNLLLGGLLALLLGKKGGGNNNGNANGNSGCLGRIIRIALIVFVAFMVLKFLGIIKTPDTGSNYTSYSVATQAPAAVQTPAPTQPPVQTQAPVVTPAPISTPVPAVEAPQAVYSQQSQSASAFDSLLGGHSYLNGGSYSSSSGWTSGSNCGVLNTEVLDGSRAKFTTLKGNGNDVVTIMVYMCGTDLESGNGMATSDLSEMAKATISDNVNLLVYTGGCSRWQNNIVSSSTNQIYKIENGGQFVRLESNLGNKAMVEPSTLAEFIQYCSSNYPANRNILIFWDHGGGSLSGYGYDELHKNAGSMTLKGINRALAAGNVKFDFIGFDACLMATVETADVCSKYADYMIASEESEPGYGWYYTNWLTNLSNNTSMSTLEIGKRIVDDFVDVSAQQCRGQDTTLSLTDLAEFSGTVPTALSNWADSTAELIMTDYSSVSKARGNSKEFAAGNRLDQVDLTNVALNLNDDSSKILANALLSAIKYNRTASSVRNAYGLSIFFPYKNVSSVNSAVSTYSDIGMDESYSRCIQAFAKYASSGQSVADNYGYGSLFDMLSGYGSYGGNSAYGSSYSSNSYSDYASYGSMDYDEVYSMLSSLFGMRGLDTISDGTSDRSIAQYVTENGFDASRLIWTRDDSGKLTISLPEDQWKLINEIYLSLFKDDGKGFIDLGLDFYDGYFDENGSLIGGFDGAWLAINGWTVAYYQVYTNGNVTIGRVPCIYNDQRANLIITIVDDEPSVSGVYYVYENGETGTQPKNLVEINEGDEITFVADYYDYDNNYQNSYKISDMITVEDGLNAEYLYLADKSSANAAYRLTDIYAHDYWTPVMENYD